MISAVIVQSASHADILGDGHRGGNPAARLSRVEDAITDPADRSRHENRHESNGKESTVSAHGEGAVLKADAGRTADLPSGY